MKRLYIVEGETEENFIIQLKSRQIIKQGKCKVFNIQEQLFTPRNSIVTTLWDEIVIIIDTDVDDKQHFDYFKKNLSIIKMYNLGCRIVVLIQNKNFEDELRYIHDIKSLKQLYKQKSEKSVKSHLTVEEHRNVDKLKLKRYCCRWESYQSRHEEIFITNAKIKSGKDL